MAEKQYRLEKLLSNLGYGSRRDVGCWVREGIITVDGKAAKSASQKVLASQVLLEGQSLDYPDGLTVIYHKPLGTVCSHKEDGRLIYDDFPGRWIDRKPALSSVGRLDKDTSGLLVVTDDGKLNHNITSPKHDISKTYAVTLDSSLQGHETDVFASGKLMLESDDTACKPAELEVTGSHTANLVLHEGRYHQVRRMFAAVGNHVTVLTRTHIGHLALQDINLKAGEYLVIEPEELLKKVCR
ncbi:MAG: pseudouridine synthase [Mariprofundaceae bacterium]